MADKFTRKITVNGDVLSMWRDDECVAQASMARVAEVYFGPDPSRIDFGILPSGVRWMSSDRRSFLIERHAGPQVVSLAMPGRFQTLPFAHQILLVTFDREWKRIAKMQTGFSSRPISTLHEEVLPFPGRKDLEITAPTTTRPLGANDVGRYLSEIWGHLDGCLYNMWAGQAKLDPLWLPTDYDPVPLDHTYLPAQFVEWWATQELPDVLVWSYATQQRIGLKKILGELDPPPDYESTWDFFADLVDKANAIVMPKEKDMLRPKIRAAGQISYHATYAPTPNAAGSFGNINVTVGTISS